MFGFLKPAPLLDETSITWLFDVQLWCLQNFDAEVFYTETVLVTPSNEHFPGRENSLHGMASLIFEQVKQHAGLQHWPCRLQEQSSCSLDQPPKLSLQGALRGTQGILQTAVPESQQLPVQYAGSQLNNPEVLIASLSQQLAFYLAGFAKQKPPAGDENWPQLIELIGLFMGFGVMFCNTANTTRSKSCGSCSGPSAERDRALSQDDLTYSLALFCHLKQIPNKAVLPHLNKHLRGYYKRALKDVQQRTQQLQPLQQMQAL
ncbi:MAG: hypothetical protein Q9N68_08165 [Gammaproteobacteria bacterium]|nr:hypothetical protein [Gammaproteobacteria bacterium]